MAGGIDRDPRVALARLPVRRTRQGRPAGGRDRRLAVETLDDLAAAVARSHPVADEVLREAAAATGRVLAAARLSGDDGALGALAALFHSSPLLAGYPEVTT